MIEVVFYKAGRERMQLFIRRYLGDLVCFDHLGSSTSYIIVDLRSNSQALRDFVNCSHRTPHPIIIPR